MTDYYIDPVSGSNSNDGLSTTTAWQTWANIGANSAWVTGNRFFGLRGTTARELIVPGADGVVLGVYGSGSSTHILSGASLESNVSFSKTVGQTIVYELSWTLPADTVAMAWEDDVRLTEQTSIANVDANPGSFYYDAAGPTMYLSASDSSDVTANGKLYELPAIQEVIDFQGADNCTIQPGLELVKCWSTDANGYGPLKVSGENNTIDGVISHNNRRHCIQLLDNASYKCANNVVKNCVGYDCLGYVISVFAVSSGSGTEDNVIQNCDFYQDINGSLDGLVTAHGAGGGPLRTTFKNSLIHDCDDSGVERAVDIYDTQSTLFQGNYIYNFKNCYIKTDALNPNFKFIANRIKWLDFTGVRPIFYVESPDAIIAQNVFLGSQNASEGVYNLFIRAGATDTRVYNNVFEQRYGMRVDADSQSGFVANGNKYFCSNANPFRWGTTMNFADWQTNSGQDANSEQLGASIIDSNLLLDAHYDGVAWWVTEGESVPDDYAGKDFVGPSIGTQQIKSSSDSGWARDWVQ